MPINWGKRLDARSRDPLYRALVGELIRMAGRNPITVDDAWAGAPKITDMIRERVPGANHIPVDAPNADQRKALGIGASIDIARTYTTKEAASILGVTRLRVRQLLIARGIGRKDDCDEWSISAVEMESLRDRRPGRPPREQDLE